MTRDMDTIHNHNCGGGTGIFIKEGLSYEILKEQSIFLSGLYESVWVKISLPKGRDVIVGSIYRPNTLPKANELKAIKQHIAILDSIKKDKKLNKAKLIITSDFNIDLLSYENNSNTTLYVNEQFSHGLHPVITTSAHITKTSAKIIDHIFVTNPPHNHLSGIIEVELGDHMPTFYSDPRPRDCI